MTPLDLNSRPVLAPGVRLQMDTVTNEPVLLYPEGVLVLNSTAHEVVTRCNGTTSISEIVAALGAEYEVDEATLRDDVVECMTDLLSRHLVVFKT